MILYTNNLKRSDENCVHVEILTGYFLFENHVIIGLLKVFDKPKQFSTKYKMSKKRLPYLISYNIFHNNKKESGKPKSSVIHFINCFINSSIYGIWIYWSLEWNSIFPMNIIIGLGCFY